MYVRFGNPVSNVWSYFFLRNCRRLLEPLTSDAGAVEARIRNEAQQVFDAKASTTPDPKTNLIYAYCSLVLAAFRQVRAETGDVAGAYDLAKQAFQNSLERPLSLMIKLWLWFVRDPVGKLNRVALADFFQRNQGESMKYAEEKTADSVDLVVHRCAFNQFFVDHGEPALTPVVCVFDRVWMNIFDRSSRPVRTERTSTLSTGGDHCRFRFIRDEEKGSVKPADVVLVQLEKTPYSIQGEKNN